MASGKKAIEELRKHVDSDCDPRNDKRLIVPDNTPDGRPIDIRLLGFRKYSRLG
jgi:hypothetical protein